MVGWSRRNSESRYRRQQRWNSLTPEEKDAARRLEKAQDRLFYRWSVIIFVGLAIFGIATLVFR